MLNIVKFLFARIGEPSTFAGLPALVIGMLQLFDVNEAGQIGAVVQDALPKAAEGDWIGSALILAAGLIAVFMPDKGAPTDLTRNLR
ncbi:hypothetical protein [Cohaesibacter celericrescens]|uniref:Uncharacterized protein n=1 Tax=Cohaesibacter celericrescens TaxID=2067669 RepID=A0A2N5XLP3_9HYPH|nr:hypothetical protein [Cohaesibacter celericrescens]PLW75414.1 hypothetical protein C0081_20320 [Cohaesibacter celericrescens]